MENLRITTESPENFNPDNDNQEVPNDDVTNFFKKRTPTLNRVPKGARQSLAELFRKLHTELLRDPTDANKWLRLLTMPKQCLKQPTRGGKKYNLTAHVKMQITDSSSSEGLARGSENGPSRPAIKRESSLSTRVSKKMDAGDVKGAVRAVSSDDSIAPDTAPNLLNSFSLLNEFWGSRGCSQMVVFIGASSLSHSIDRYPNIKRSLRRRIKATPGLSFNPQADREKQVRHILRSAPEVKVSFCGTTFSTTLLPVILKSNVPPLFPSNWSRRSVQFQIFSALCISKAR